MRVTTRAEWGARPAGRNVRAIGTVNGIAWHYTAGNADFQRDHRLCDDRVRGVQNAHMSGRGYNDGAYSWMFCNHGAIYLMRGFGVRSAAQGTNHGNEHYYAVCYLGGPSSPLTDAAKRAALALRAEIRKRHPSALDDRPHDYFHATSCPGPVKPWIVGGLKPPAAPRPSSPPPARASTIYIVRRLDGTYYGQRPNEAQALEVARLLLREGRGVEIEIVRR